MNGRAPADSLATVVKGVEAPRLFATMLGILVADRLGLCQQP